MKISIRSMAGLTLAVLLVGCGGQEKIVKEEVPDCTFPDSPSMAAPDWICDTPVEGVAVSAVGMFRKTKAGAQFQKTQAAAAARNMLAAQMQVHVKQLVKNYSAVTGVGDEETVDTVSSDVSKQVTAATLYGSKVYKTRANPETGALYVLVGLDPNQAAAQATEALKTSYKNKKAQWQKFLAGKADDELDAEFEKIANQDL